MCGSPNVPMRHLSTIHGETLIERTVRLLKEAGVPKKDIRIAPSIEVKNELAKRELPATLLMYNHNKTGLWCDCFHPQIRPCTYIFGDVVFSPNAIKTIVETDTDDIEFFASAPPFSSQYSKEWAEPFAFKVEDTAHLIYAIDKVHELQNEGKFKRNPIAWELWQVIKNTPINKIDYTNYTVINDYTCDVDTLEDIYKFEGGNVWQC